MTRESLVKAELPSTSNVHASANPSFRNNNLDGAKVKPLSTDVALRRQYHHLASTLLAKLLF